MKLKQFELTSVDGSNVLVCWLEDDKRLKPGTVISLKGIDGVRWKVNRFWTITVEKDDLKRGWKVDI